jgi:DNA-binding HxlR family transcriptional regulator
MKCVRSYDQFCGAARALDIVGDRWTLLIVRELLTQGPCRYTDLRDGLPGIASNLLAERLRELERNGIITREDAPPPIATTLFRLTPRGEALRPVLEALGQWGAPLLSDLGESAAFRSHWLALPLERRLRGIARSGPPVTIEVHTGDHAMLIETRGKDVRVRPGSAPNADATLRGSPALIIGLMSGELDLDSACAQGLEFEGDRDALRRVQPSTQPQTDRAR